MTECTAEPDRTRRLVILAAILAGVVFCYPLTLGIPLLDPDEGLHASMAQEMVERGDWLTPHLFGKPFFDKPVFYFWFEALSLWLFGMSEAAVRLPGLMFGLLGAVTTGLVAWRMFGRTAGMIAGMFYATTVLPTALAQAAAPDVALVPWVNLALLLFWECERSRSRRARLGATLGIGVCLGLTCLTKGLVGIALVGVAYGSYILIARRLTWAVCLRGAASLAIAGAIAAAWYVAVEVRNPGYLYYFFVERHLLGYATGTQVHGTAHWWYYLPLLLGGGLPWIGYLPVTLRDAWTRRRETNKEPQSRGPADGSVTLLLCWLVGCTVFLSIAHSKLVTYIWPVFPPVAILAAMAWARVIDGSLHEGARRWFSGTLWSSSAAAPAVLPVVLIVVQKRFGVTLPWYVWLASVAAGCSCVLPAWLWAKRRPQGTLVLGLLGVAAQFVIIMTFVLPWVAADMSARELARYFNARGAMPPRLWLVEDRIGSLVFYLDPGLRAGLSEGQLQEVRSKEMPETAALEVGTLLAIPKRRLSSVVGLLHLEDAPYVSVGHYRLYKPRWGGGTTATLTP